MTRKRLRTLLASFIPLTVLIIFILFTTVPVFAVAQPDSGPFIVNYKAFENLYELGDIGLLLEYNIPYASLPDDSATVNFLVRYKSAAGAVLQTKAPYSYSSLGYNYGATMLYWLSTDGSLPTWGEMGTIEVMGNPTVSWAGGTIPYVSAPMMPSYWLSSTTVDEGQTQFNSFITTYIAIDLENRWNTPLTAQSSTSTILNASYGQQYFGAIIPYFTTICADILTMTGAKPVNPPPKTAYVTTYEESLKSTIPNSTVIGPSINSAAASVGISPETWMFIAFLVVMAFVLSMVAATFEAPAAVPLIFIPVFIGCIKIGVVGMALGVGACAILFIISMYLLIHRRAAV